MYPVVEGTNHWAEEHITEHILERFHLILVSFNLKKFKNRRREPGQDQDATDGTLQNPRQRMAVGL